MTLDQPNPDASGPHPQAPTPTTGGVGDAIDGVLDFLEQTENQPDEQELTRRVQELLSGLDELYPEGVWKDPQQSVPTEVLSGLQQVISVLEELSFESPLAPNSSMRDELEVRLAESEAHADELEQANAQKIDLLRCLLRMKKPVFEPTLRVDAQLGHSCIEVDQGLGLDAGGSIPVLEELANLGLLKRELFNHVNTCPACGVYNLNFRESCINCTSIDISVESIVHHFHCAYHGIESEFSKGIDLVCPKCRRHLHQLGQDFERPHDTYVCQKCRHYFEDPTLEVQCFNCGAQHHASEVQVVELYRYVPTPLTLRAVEQRRLTGLEVSQILYDADVKLTTRDFLEFEANRELLRLKRYGSCFTTATLTFEGKRGIFPLFNEWRTGALKQLAQLLNDTLRNLDLVARVSDSALGVLLLETDEPGSASVEQRIHRQLQRYQFTDGSDSALRAIWTAVTWSDKSTSIDEVLAFFDGQSFTQ